MPKKATEAAASTGSRLPGRRRRAARRRRSSSKRTWDHVATRAYYIHLEEGGDPTENWLRAERELIAA